MRLTLSKQPRWMVWGLLLVVACLGVVGCQSSSTEVGLVRSGVIDLSKVDFGIDPRVSLEGEWRGLPGELLRGPVTEADWSRAEPVKVPGNWREAGRQLPRVGTYLLRLRLSDHAGSVSLDMPPVSAATEVWVNGRRVGGRGRIDPTGEAPRYERYLARIEPDSEGWATVAILLSNHYHVDFGIKRAISVGRTSVLQASQTRAGFLGWMIFAAAMVIGIHYFLTFVISRDQGYAYFALLALAIGIKTLCYDGLQYVFWPNLGQHFSLRVEYLGLVMLPVGIWGFVSRLFPIELSAGSFRRIAGIGLVAATLVVLAPVRFVTGIRDFLILFVFVGFILAGWAVVRAHHMGRPGSRVMLASMAIAISAMVFDMATFFWAPWVPPTATWALILYSFGNAMALGLVVQRTSEQVRALGENLADLNASLEERIEARTRELSLSEQRFRDVSEAVGEFIWEADRRAVVTFASERVGDVLGYQPEELIGRTIFSLMPPESRADAAMLFEPARHREGFRGVEINALAADGRRLVLALSALPTFGPKGVFTGWRGAARDVTDRKIAERKLEELARTDPLTRLANRRWFQERADQLARQCRRQSWPLSLLILDIDRFKHVNDTFGHDIGDEVIQGVARVLSGLVREIDLVSRLGGEEFAVLLPNSNRETALAIAERVRATLETATVSRSVPDLAVTASIGVVSAEGDEIDLREMMRQADKALYAAKRAGRNRVRFGKAMETTEAA